MKKKRKRQKRPTKIDVDGQPVGAIILKPALSPDDIRSARNRSRKVLHGTMCPQCHRAVWFEDLACYDCRMGRPNEQGGHHHPLRDALDAEAARHHAKIMTAVDNLLKAAIRDDDREEMVGTLMALFEVRFSSSKT